MRPTVLAKREDKDKDKDKYKDKDKDLCEGGRWHEKQRRVLLQFTSFSPDTWDLSDDHDHREEEEGEEEENVTAGLPSKSVTIAA